MDNIRIERVENPDLKAKTCNSILRGLPLWFGIESAVEEYVNRVREMETWAALDGENVIGFVSVKKHFAESAEIYVMGIVVEFHRKGIGRKIIKEIDVALKAQGFKFLTVKTLSGSRPNIQYDQSRKFYLNMGFKPLEEFKNLWGETNPCLLMIKNL